MDFRKRMAVLFILLSLVPFIILQINTQVFYIPTITNRIKALFTYNLQQKSENLQRLLVERVNILSQIVNDRALAQDIREINDTADPSAYQKSKLIDVFSRYTIINDLMVGIGYIRNDGAVIEYDRFGLRQDFTGFAGYGSVSAIMEKVGASGSQVTYPTITYRAGPGPSRNIIMTVFPYYNLGTNTREGFIFILLNEAAFQKVLNPLVGDNSGIVARSILWDGQGKLVSFPGDFAFGTGPDVPVVKNGDLTAIGHLIPELKGRSLDWISLPIPRTDWTISTIYDEQSLFSDRTNIVWYTFLLGLVFFLSGSLVIYTNTRKLLKSFSRLVELVRVQDNRLDIRSDNRDELEYLGTAFRHMQEHIQGLVTDVNERNARMLALAEEQRLAEIRALEAQVNPHFLYNTLNTLNWIAIRNQQPELSKGLSDLADIMRYSISQIEVTASLADEIAWLRKYLDLQQLRFRHNFSYTIENRGVDPQFSIFKLLFQPLVENSLVHGFDPNTPGGLLAISFEMGPAGHLVATIRDNGRGLAPGQQHEAGGPASIGLSNLERRLAVYHGDEASVSWQSPAEGGTVVVLEIPEARA